MAGSIVLIKEVTVSSAAATVTLGGAEWDSSYDVYMVKVSDVNGSSDQKSCLFRFIDTSNNALNDANYDASFETLISNTGYEDAYGSNATFGYCTDLYVGNETGETANSTMYIFNANNASGYTYASMETTYLSQAAVLRGQQGGCVYTQSAATKGIQFFMYEGNIAQGKFSLYGIKK